MKNQDETKAVEVFAGSIFEAEILKSILADNEIESYLQDEYMGTIAPWNAVPGGVGAVKVIVSSEDQQKTEPLVQQYINNLNKPTDNDTSEN